MIFQKEGAFLVILSLKLALKLLAGPPPDICPLGEQVEHIFRINNEVKNKRITVRHP